MITSLGHLSDGVLTREVGRLAGCERSATAALIVHLAEFDARRLFEGAGYSSLFKYCVHVLRLSEDAVYNRIEVARAVRQYPAIAGLLQSGALSPTTARMVAGHLTRESHEELLRAASWKSKAGVEELLAHWYPRPDVAGRVRELPSPAGVSVTVPDPVPPAESPSSSPSPISAHSSEAVSAPAPPLVGPTPRQMVRPIAPTVPSGDIAEVFDRALIQLVSNLRKRKFAATTRPRRRQRAQSSDPANVTAEVKRAVTARDQGRCAFVAKTGHHCGERRFLEFHHV